MSNIILKDLNFSRSRHWLLDAKDKQNIDPVYSFIASWISFNHYYGAFAASNPADFLTWSTSNMRGSSGDRAQLMYLINKKEFSDFFNTFKLKQKELFDTKIDLPIINLLNKHGVPADINGEFKLTDLQVEQIFQAIYQIRNNLFHGGKDLFTNERDMALSTFGSKFMLLFLSTLLTHTYGEELDVYDAKKMKEIDDVANIARKNLDNGEVYFTI